MILHVIHFLLFAQFAANVAIAWESVVMWEELASS